MGADGGPVEAGTPAVLPGAGVPLRNDSTIFTDLAVAASLSQLALHHDDTAAVLVCALRESEFVGDPERDRSGHIPGSRSIPFPTLLDATGRIDVAATRRLAGEQGVNHRPVVAYCGGGVHAAGLALAFEYAGLPLPQVYDGSLNEWRDHPELPVATGPAAG